MGYSTDFAGELRFTRELTGSELAHLSSMFGESPEKYGAKGVGYIQYQLTKDFSGIEWDGGEKAYDMELHVNTIITEMRKIAPDFGLTGALQAQGEDAEDRWDLVIGDDGWAKRVDRPPTGTKITCPHCNGRFFYEGAA